MSIRIRAHFDGRFLVPEHSVDLPLNQPLDVEVTARGVTATNGEQASAATIAERLRRLEALSGLLEGPVIPLDALRRENLYDDRA